MTDSAERPRVAVYAIAKDESTQVRRWAASAADADVLILVDTGSSDDTVTVARSLGVEVHEVVVEPFRFDVARNEALDLVPTDVDLCVPLDLDEVLAPGWRDRLDEVWTPAVTRMTFGRVWRWNESAPPHRYRDDRIHARGSYRWVHPVHEQPVSSAPEVVVDAGVEVVHHRDPAAARPQYLPLLQLAVDEAPDDGRLAHMLANEYRMRGMTAEARQHAHRALALDLATDERWHAMLMLSWLEPEHEEEWLVAAVGTAPDRREPWCELARHHEAVGAWRASLGATRAALAVTEPAGHYLENATAWAQWPHRLGAVAAEALGDLDAAVRFARATVRAAPADPTSTAELHRLLDRLTAPQVGAPPAGTSRPGGRP